MIADMPRRVFADMTALVTCAAAVQVGGAQAAPAHQ